MTRQEVEIFEAIASQFRGQDIISVRALTLRDLEKCIFPEADKMRALVERFRAGDLLRGYTLALAFYESSSRTFNSFDAAMKHLGGMTIFPPGKIEDFSSVSKGESFPDTMRMFESYANAIVLRHPEVGMAARAAEICEIPIINAGDGIGEHPTQALLDLYTIRTDLGKIRGKTVVLMGDLKNGRTIHSLARLLTLYQDVKVICVSPSQVRLSDELISELKSRGLEPMMHDRLDEVLPQADVVYVTRVQRERFSSDEEYQAVQGSYVISAKTLAKAKPAGQMILMHPLPRVGEIHPDVDNDQRAAYFRQMRYGMYVRMALLALVFGKI